MTTVDELVAQAKADAGVSPNGSLPPGSSDRLYDGIAFAEMVEATGPSVWGTGEQVLWSPGEPLMLYGPQGVGKTTTAQRLTLGRAGIDDVLLGLAVAPDTRPILYVAADRPKQAVRSWRRMIALLGEEQRALVRERVRFWKGPLPFDIGTEPDKLLEFALALRVGTFVGDSLKDLAMELVKDDVGARVNRAWQLLVQNEIEVLDLHHPRKTAAGQTSKPGGLDDVYGSGWLTAGHGSVVLLWGKPGDPILELSHLKQPLEEVGPFRVLVEHELGMIERHEGGDLLAIVRASPGITAGQAACVLFSTSRPTDSQVEKTRRKLERHVDGKRVFRRAMGRDARGHPQPVTYFATAAQASLEEV